MTKSSSLTAAMMRFEDSKTKLVRALASAAKWGGLIILAIAVNQWITLVLNCLQLVAHLFSR